MRTALIAALVALAACAGAAAQDDAAETSAAEDPPVLPIPANEPESLAGEARAAMLAEIDDYLSQLGVLTGSFFQIEPSGVVSQGQFWIDRPGRMRFEYADPHPFTLIADGATYTVWDRELDDVNTRVPLRETPLNLFLKRDVELDRDADVLNVVQTPGEIAVTLKDHDERVEGTLTLVFARPALELRRFLTTDEAGGATEVVLTDAVRGGEVDPTLFVVREPHRRERR